MRLYIRIYPEEFNSFCNDCKPATKPNNSLTHRARVFLFLYYVEHKISFDELGLLFNISSRTASSVYNDIEMYLLMFDPYIPAWINDPNIPDSAIEQLLMSVNNAQSLGIQRIVSTLRSPDGRQSVHLVTIPQTLEVQVPMIHSSKKMFILVKGARRTVCCLEH